MNGRELALWLMDTSLDDSVSGLILQVRTVSEEIDRMGYLELDSFLGLLDVSLLPSSMIVLLLGALGPYRGVLLNWDVFFGWAVRVLESRYSAEDVLRTLDHLGLKMS